MRTGAIFARGSCRALKWMALVGMVFALGAGQALAQVTVSAPEMMDEQGTATITVTGKAYIPAGTTTETEVTLTIAPDVDATDATHEATDLNTNRSFVATLTFSENTGEDAVPETQTATITLEAVHDNDAEDENVVWTNTLAGVGNLTEDMDGNDTLDLVTTGDNAAPTSIKIDDDETQEYLLTEDDPGDAKEGSDAIELTLKTRYPIEDSSVTLTLGHDGGSGWTLDTTPSEPADTDPTVEVTVVHSAPGDTAVPEDFSQEVTLTGPMNDENRSSDTVTVTMYSGGVTDRMMQGSLGVVIADVHALPAGSAITAMAYDEVTGGNMVTSVEAGDTVYLAVEVDRGDDGYPMGEMLEVALSLSDDSLATLGDDEVDIDSGMGKKMSSPRVSLEVASSNMINPETLMVNLNAKGANDTANGPSGDGVMGMPLSLMITQPDGNEPRITAKSKPMVDAAVDAAMMAGAGDDGFNPGEMFELDPNDLFDVVDGYMLELSSVDSSNTAKVGAGAINGIARIEATADGNADVTITARATMGSSSATIVDQILLDEAQIIVPVSVVLAPGPDPVAPSAPQNLMAAAGDGQVMLSWEAPATGDPPTGYQYRVTVPGVMGGWTDTSSATMLEETVTGLINETEYTFHVRAVNDAGNSPESNEAKATPMAVIPPEAPGMPQNLMAVAGNTQVDLTWDAPVTGDAPTGYRYRATVAGAEGSWSVTQDTSATVTDLANGTTYTFEVVAFNDAGASDAATTTATPMEDPVPVAPSAPQNLMATAGDGQVTLRWEAPSSGDAPTGYQYRATVAGVMGEWMATSSATMLEETVTGLTNGTEYTFHVRAVNDTGNSPESNAAMATPMAVIPPEAPGMPQNLMAVAGNTQVDLTWDAPTTGDAPTGYRYRASVPGAEGTWSVTTATSVTVTDLANGTTYTFEVVAFNDAGASDAATTTATPAEPVVPPDPVVPGAPQNLTAAAGDEQVTLSWDAPATGDAPTGYEYRSAIGTRWSPWATTSSTSATVTDLTNGTEYTFEVRAVNSAGEGDAASVKATPMAPPPGVQVTVKEVNAATSVAESGGLEVTVVATVPAGTKGSDDKVAPIAMRRVTVSFPTDDATIKAGEEADAGELTVLGDLLWEKITRTEKDSDQEFKFRVAVGQDLDAEDEKFQVEVSIDGAPKKSKVVTIDDAQEQTYELSLPSAAKGAVKEGGSETLTLEAKPKRTIDISFTLALNPNDPTKYTLGTTSGMFGMDSTSTTISAKADGNRDDDAVTVTAYTSGTLGNDVEIASLDITIMDANALPMVKAEVVDKDGKALDPQPESVMEGETVKVKLTVVDKDGKAAKAAEKLSISLMPTGMADGQDYRLSTHPIEIAKDKESSAVVDLMVTEDSDVGDETLTFSAVVGGESKNGTEKKEVPGVLSLMITDGTQRLVWANSQEEVEAAIYAAKNAGAGNDMTFTTGETIEVMGALLFSSAEGVTLSYTAESSMNGVASTSVSGGSVMVTAMAEGMADITITAHANMPSGVKILDQTDPGMASVMFPVEVGLEALAITLSGPADMNLAEGMSAEVTATANRPVTADTTVMLMRDRAQSSAGDADYSAEAITIAAGMSSGSTMVMAIEDSMAEDMEELVLYGMTEGMAGEVTGEVKLYLWDAAVPALPIIAQLLLAAFLAVGGYRRYRRR